MAEWSKATVLRSVLFGGAGSNPAGTIKIKKAYSKLFYHSEVVNVSDSKSEGSL